MNALRPLKSWLSCGLFVAAMSTTMAWADTPVQEPADRSVSQAISPSLGEAAISNQVLRIVLNGQAQISLYNARGQLLYQAEGRSGVEWLPLKSVDLGFIYLTLRQGKTEQSFRLLHSGK
jgi:uncharacterized protein YfaP (DUF2135 family)